MILNIKYINKLILINFIIINQAIFLLLVVARSTNFYVQINRPYFYCSLRLDITAYLQQNFIDNISQVVFFSKILNIIYWYLIHKRL